MKLTNCTRGSGSCVSLGEENRNNSITRKFAYSLDVLFLVFHKMKNNKSTSKDIIRGKRKNKSKRKKKLALSGFACMILTKCRGKLRALIG